MCFACGTIKKNLLYMNTHHHIDIGTVSLADADIAFFPLIAPPLPSLEYFNHEDVLGFAHLPPIVANRLRIYEEKRRTFYPKNRPLEYAYFSYRQLREGRRVLDEFWSGVIADQQRRGFPKVFIIAPQEACETIISEYAARSGLWYYYHNPCSKTSEGERFLLSFCYARQKICSYLTRNFDLKKHGSFIWT